MDLATLLNKTRGKQFVVQIPCTINVSLDWFFIVDEAGQVVRVQLKHHKSGLHVDGPASKISQLGGKLVQKFLEDPQFVQFEIFDASGNMIEPDTAIHQLVRASGSLGVVPENYFCVLNEPKWNGYRESTVIHVGDYLFFWRDN